MQTQQDLINLISLKMSDEKLIKHFDALSLKQPKSCTPNNSRSDVSHKELNVDYYFNYEVTYETCHPPKRQGKAKKWASYLNSICFVNGSQILKKPDPKPASFWNVTPPPSADMATLTAFYCEPATSKFN